MARRLLLAALALAAAACSRPASAPQAPAPPTKDEVRPAPAAMPAELAATLAPLQERMKAEPGSFAAAAAVADALFDHARYVEAVDVYRQALERAGHVLSLLDELSAAARGPLPSAAQAGCAAAGAAEVEAQAARARARREKGEPGEALVCARQAAAPVLAAAARRGQALFLLGNVDQAASEYQKVLKRDPDAPEALFFAGALQVNRRGAGPGQLEDAQAAWKRFLEVAPRDHPRRDEVEKSLPLLEAALARARSQAALPPGHPAAGAAEQPADLASVLEAAEEALAQGDGAAAARAYLEVMSSAADDPRVQAGLAASQFLKGTAMAPKVFEVAAAHDPAAIDALAGRLEKKGNPGLARTLRQQLRAAAPDDAAKAGDGQRER